MIAVIAAGASTMRSWRRDAENTVMVSATETTQSTTWSTVVVSPADTETSETVDELSPRVNVRVYVPGATPVKL